MAKLTHVDRKGKASMVDVGAKRVTKRRAVATASVAFGPKAFALLAENRLEKGDAIAVARVAGILAGKRTSEWIPLCHEIPLERLDVTIELRPKTREAVVTATAVAEWKTGVEMEALVAVSAACLTLYDMAKAVDRGITVSRIHLVEKSGGRSGTFRAKKRVR
jgi:cyclic pyranopterin phosphate synthase